MSVPDPASSSPVPSPAPARPQKPVNPGSLAMLISAAALFLAIVALLTALLSGLSKGDIATLVEQALKGKAEAAQLAALRTQVEKSVDAQTALTAQLAALRSQVANPRPFDASALEGRIDAAEKSVRSLSTKLAAKADAGHTHGGGQAPSTTSSGSCDFTLNGSVVRTLTAASGFGDRCTTALAAFKAKVDSTCLARPGQTREVVLNCINTLRP